MAPGLKHAMPSAGVCEGFLFWIVSVVVSCVVIYSVATCSVVVGGGGDVVGVLRFALEIVAMSLRWL